MKQAPVPAADPLSVLAVIIPVLNCRDDLQVTLRALPRVGEVIVVDGGSTDGSAQVATRHGAKLVTTRPSRGVQLRAGAERATADWFLFLHGDTRLDAAAWSEIRSTLATGGAARAASFRFALNDEAWQARLLELGVRIRGALLALPYGDQGLLIHRSLYQEVGGYRELALMEDVDFVWRLGRRRLLRLEGCAITSSQRWRRRGWTRQTLANLRCLLLFLAGAPIEKIVRTRGR